MTSKKELAAIFIGLIINIAIMLLVAATLLKLLWAWIIPELFPGAVAQNLILPALSWSLSFKLVVLASVVLPLFSRKYTYIAPGSDKR